MENRGSTDREPHGPRARELPGLTPPIRTDARAHCAPSCSTWTARSSRPSSYWGQAMAELARGWAGRCRTRRAAATIGTSMPVVDGRAARGPRGPAHRGRSGPPTPAGSRSGRRSSWPAASSGGRGRAELLRRSARRGWRRRWSPRRPAGSRRSCCGRSGRTSGDDPFDVTVCGDEVPARKPDPAPYLQAMDALDVEPGDCVVIEDSRAGIGAGLAAGDRRARSAGRAGRRAGCRADRARVAGRHRDPVPRAAAEASRPGPDRRLTAGRYGAACRAAPPVRARGPAGAVAGRSRRSAGRRPPASRSASSPAASRPVRRSRPQASGRDAGGRRQGLGGGHAALVTRSATPMGTSPCRLLGPMPASVPATRTSPARQSSATCGRGAARRSHARPRALPAPGAAARCPAPARGWDRRGCRRCAVDPAAPAAGASRPA